MITRIDPPLELMTPRGPGWAHFLIDYHLTTDLVWVVFQKHTGECWSYRNKDVRAASCETWGIAGEAATPTPLQPSTALAVAAPLPAGGGGRLGRSTAFAYRLQRLLKAGGRAVLPSPSPRLVYHRGVE